MKIWLAPLHGITYYYYRNLLVEHASGVQAAIAPFQPVLPTEKLNVRKWKDLWPENNTRWEVIPQLMGNITSHFIDTANALSELGYQRFNWNIGCPAKQVTRKKRGCGLMPFPDMIEEVVASFTAKTSFAFSIKMRLGMHAREEGREIIERLNRYPLDFIVIHPRLGEWQYSGKPDLDELELLLDRTRHRVIYSGDITTVDYFNELKNRFPEIDEWMIGRGLIQNPFLAEKIIKSQTEEIEEQDLKSRFLTFHHDLLTTLIAFRGERAALPLLKELWHYYARFWGIDDSSLTALLRINDYRLFVDQTASIMSESGTITMD